MNTQDKNLYESPKMKISEARMCSILCGSTTGEITPMDWGADDGSNWN